MVSGTWLVPWVASHAGGRPTTRNGTLATRLRAVGEQRFRPPGSDITRSFGVSTLANSRRREAAGGLLDRAMGRTPRPGEDDWCHLSPNTSA